VAQILLSELRVPFVGRDGVEYRMGAEAAVGRNWGKKTKYNPDGMLELKL
jgi:hypothetical protein